MIIPFQLPKIIIEIKVIIIRPYNCPVPRASRRFGAKVKKRLVENLSYLHYLDTNKVEGYKMGHGELKIICYADDVVFISNTENNPQLILHTFNKPSENCPLPWKITQCLTISKRPVRCKLEINNTIIVQTS